MLAISVKARETVDCDRPSRLARTSAVTARVRCFAAFGFLMSAGTKNAAAALRLQICIIVTACRVVFPVPSDPEPLELHNDRKTGWKNSDCYGRFAGHWPCGCQTFFC